jgi:hypothetical protein
MSSYYHIRIKYLIGEDSQFGGVKVHATTFYYEINLADTEVVKISDQYQKGEDIFFDGITLFNRRIEEIKIFSTTYSYFILSKKYIKTTFKEGYDFSGQEVTRMFITRPPDHPKDENPLTITREGIFFKGQQYDSFKKIRDLLDSAESSIIVIDGYVDESILDILESRETVKIKILTHSDREKIIKTAGTKFNEQYHNLEIKILDDYHDRFVIIDDKDFYHFGASIKDLGKRSFMFSLIEEPKIINAFRAQFNEDWSKATEVKL